MGEVNTPTTDAQPKRWRTASLNDDSYIVVVPASDYDAAAAERDQHLNAFYEAKEDWDRKLTAAIRERDEAREQIDRDGQAIGELHDELSRKGESIGNLILALEKAESELADQTARGEALKQLAYDCQTRFMQLGQVSDFNMVFERLSALSSPPPTTQI